MGKQLHARYSGVAQMFHWVTAILVLAAFIYGPGGSELRVYAPQGDFDRQLHETLGLAVFAIAVLRVLWRFVGTRPQPVEVSRWMGFAATAVQVALYILLFALPLTGVAGAWLEAHPLTLLGGLRIPSPIPPSHDLGATIASVHTWLGDAIMWIAGLHALAALYHHFILKDGLLASMLPSLPPKQ
jgi:cytochrome b561